MKRFFAWLGKHHDAAPSCRQIIWWWEARRIPYNLIIGPLGIIGLAGFFLFIYLANVLKPGEDAIEPMAIVAAPFAINIMYTSGWMAEIFLKLLWEESAPNIGPFLFKLGLSFSVLVVLFPAASWLVVWLTTLM